MGKLMTKLNRMKRTILFYVLCVFTLCTYAQGISVSAPSHVATGENFRLTYSINAQSVDGRRIIRPAYKNVLGVKEYRPLAER